MRTQFFKFFIIIIAATSFVACNSDDDNNTDSEGSYIRAQIDNVNWEANETVTSTVLQVGDLGMRFDLTAQNDDFRFTLAAKQFTVNNCMDLTSYEGDNILAYIWYGFEDGTYGSYHDKEPSLGNPGEENFIINISSCENGLISGTFSGTQYLISSSTIYPEAIEITNGEFQNVPFTFTVVED